MLKDYEKYAGVKDLTNIMSGNQDYNKSHISIVGGFVPFLGGFAFFFWKQIH